jgi:hypothetical protein
MKRILLAATALAAISLAPMTANATLMIAEETFADLGGTGFGVAPRLLTLQNDPNESGGTVAGAGGTTIFVNGSPTGPVCTSNGTCTNGTRTGTNESLVYNLAALGWTSGAEVGIGLDTNQTANPTGPLLFKTLDLTLYSSTGAVLGTFSGDGPVLITQQQLADQQGNGNSVFNIKLDAAQQAQFDTILAANGGAANIFEGLNASFGCTITVGTSCVGQSVDGAESFLAFRQSAVPGPIAGAGIPGLIAAVSGMFGLNRWRKRRNGVVA